MESYIGRIWVSLIVLVVVVLIVVKGDSLGAIDLQAESPFMVALRQLGILYVVALFVERSLQVILKAWRQGQKEVLKNEVEANNSDPQAVSKLTAYKSGTQRRALLLSLTLGLLVSVSGVRLLGPIFQLVDGSGSTFQMALFNFTDIFITAGLIAGGSATIHELMALVDDFLKTTRTRTKK